MKTLLFSAALLLSLFTGPRAAAQCNPDCGMWVIENLLPGCCLDFIWESPGPCIRTQGITPVCGGLRTECAPMFPEIFSDPPCPEVCAWALRLVDPNNPFPPIFYQYGGSPNVYFNVIQCAACSSGWAKATYIPMPGSVPNHILRFECQ